jgi:hypothetical protein
MLKFWLTTPLYQDPVVNDPAGGNQPPVFDQAAFKAEMLGEFNKTLNGFAKTLKADFGKMLQPPAPPNPDPPAPDPAPNGGDPKPKDPHVAGLELQFKQYREATDKKLKDAEDLRQAAERKSEEENRLSLIRAKLGKMNIREDAFEDAFDVFGSKVKRADDGSLIAGDLPYEQYIETQLGGPKAYMLKPKEASGSGAGKNGNGYNGKPVDLNDIKPGMSPETRAAATASIIANSNQP